MIGAVAGRFENKVVFITGAARGQGRSHAVRFAKEGADIIALDLCDQIASAPYPMSTPEDLAETTALVEAEDRRIVAKQADVRDTAQVHTVVEAGLAEFGKLDVVVANAGITGFSPALSLTDEQWNDMIDTNLTGVFKTLRATLPTMVEQGTGGSAVVISSAMGIKPGGFISHYAAAKAGLIGFCRSLANELAPDRIRVNTVHPTAVDTPMLQNEPTMRLFLPAEENPTKEQFAAIGSSMHPLGIPWVDSSDVSNAVLYLASDEARYLTGVALPVDGGFVIK